MFDSGRDGVDETVGLLASLDISLSYSNLQLIWEFSKWVLQKNPEKGVKVVTFAKTIIYLLICQIFASRSRPVEIPPKQVIEYLNPFGPLVVQMFLEFQIIECDNQDPDLHTKLVLIYLETIKVILPSGTVNQGMLNNRFVPDFI